MEVRTGHYIATTLNTGQSIPIAPEKARPLGAVHSLWDTDSRPKNLHQAIGYLIKGRPDSNTGYYMKKSNLGKMYGVTV